MEIPFETDADLEAIAELAQREYRLVMNELGPQEFAKCADDIFYWLDSARHSIPYVYTIDPRENYVCNLCKGGKRAEWTHSQFRLPHHLKRSHNLEVPTKGDALKHFTLLDPMRPWPMKPYMEPIIRAWFQEPLIAIEKSRDMMASWLVTALYLWDTAFHPGRENLFQGQNSGKTRRLVEDYAWRMWKAQPKFLRRQHPAEYSGGRSKAGELVIPSLDSAIFGLPMGADQVRSYHPQGIFFDEAAFNDDAQKTFGAAKPAIQAGGRVTMLSSANPSFFQLVTEDRTNE